jgi:hypothetical protein
VDTPFSGKANVPYDNAESSSRNKQLQATYPYAAKFGLEFLVVRHVAELSMRELWILLEVPVGGRGYH